ncbi:MAG: hypothetical protein NZ927_03740 [Candidatus Calescibacterium sp.]|nr:hypothetical protein [Candidatus Calescibacterium sp.]MCX7733506.1 hypothetical protein [bacterium]MDW8087219.1 CbiQ family ECF transporter T component [Candidatus Calescibacterium sp.]
MKHSFFDKYSYINSPVHKINPVLKLILFLSIGILLNIIPFQIVTYILIGSVTLVITYLSKVPLIFILKRTLVILPFVFVIALTNFFSKLSESTVLYKTFLNAYIMITLLILLTQTTKFPEMLKSLSYLRVPKLILVLLSFIYRYFFILIDEAEKMIYSAKIRTYKRLKIRTIGAMIGVLFIKTYDRSERVYWSMLLRGFDGKIK